MDAITIPNDDHTEDSYMKEFEQGDFSHVLWQTKYSAKELLHALLTSETARDDVKFSLLKKMGRDIHYVGQELNEEYKEYARKHNDVVRIKLRDFFEKTDIRDLMDRGLDNIHAYNNFYRKLYGGKSFNNISVKDLDHERHDKYLIKRKEHIQRCVSHLVLSHLRNSADMVTYYMSLFNAQEIVDVVKDMKLSEDRKNIILKHIDDLRKGQEKK